MVGIDKMSSSMLNSEMRQEVLNLMTQKNKIEAEIKEFFDILATNNVGMHEALVDREGFPRNDIDVYQIRTARHKIICLQNDHKGIMSKIEAGLHKLHGAEAEAGSQAGDQQMETEWPEAFAKVTVVTACSPADICGLKINDQLLEFGSVNKSNFRSMQDVASVVRYSVGQRVGVVVRREGRHSPLVLDLVPQSWAGQGLLGCKIDPLPNDTVER